MFIQTEETPNPESLKFLPGVNISSTPLNFLNADEADISPLAQKILTLESVKSVFLGYDFITVTKKENCQWQLIKPEILVTIMDFLISGQAPVKLTKSEKISEPDENKIVAEIMEIIETRVRPAVMQDGGDIVFHEFKDGIVKLQLHGACSGCPSSTVTLKDGIENMLKHYIPEVISVEAV